MFNWQTIWPLILSGIIGGFIRALVGLGKYFEQHKTGGKIQPAYLAYTLLVSAVVGGLAGALAGQDWRVAALAGYAGTDFLEGLYSLKFGRAVM